AIADADQAITNDAVRCGHNGDRRWPDLQSSSAVAHWPSHTILSAPRTTAAVTIARRPAPGCAACPPDLSIRYHAARETTGFPAGHRGGVPATSNRHDPSAAQIPSTAHPLPALRYCPPTPDTLFRRAAPHHGPRTHERNAPPTDLPRHAGRDVHGWL